MIPVRIFLSGSQAKGFMVLPWKERHSSLSLESFFLKNKKVDMQNGLAEAVLAFEAAEVWKSRGDLR
jgi:hypothetical protein